MESINPVLSAILALTGIGNYAQDSNVARQGVMNHQQESHLCTLAFIRDHTEMSIPESYACQGLAGMWGKKDA